MTRLPFRRPAHGASPEEGELRQLSDRLDAERPRPRPEFARDLRQLLAAESAAEPQPAGPVLAVAAYVLSGTGCLLVAALGAAGAGPLA